MSTKLKKCFKEGERNSNRHKGIRKIKPNTQLAKGHLIKALHNFEAMNKFHNMKYSDWSASAAFYTLYHGLLAILAQQGYESRNQSCTLVLIQDLISKKKLEHLTTKDINEIFDSEITDIEHSSKILDIRERMQYSVHTSLVEEEFKLLQKRTKEILDNIRLDLEQLTQAPKQTYHLQ